MSSLPTAKKWTVEEYHHMLEVEIISPDERVELVDGEIISMAAKKPPHVITTELIAEYLRELLRGVAHIRVQDPVALSDRSEPEPDIAVVMPPLRRYIDHHPAPREIFLIIEVAASTWRFDSRKKSEVYARSEIADYWVVDVAARFVYVQRSPLAGIYTNTSVFNESDTINLVAFPETEVVLQEFFP